MNNLVLLLFALIIFLTLIIVYLYENQPVEINYQEPKNKLSTFPKITLYQADNRLTLDLLIATQKVNKKMCEKYGMKYKFIELRKDQYTNVSNFMTKKIYLIYDLLLETNDDMIMFLDSDAYVYNGKWLKDIIENIASNDDIHGCYSRDPYIEKKLTYINSGVFILKVNEFTKNMYKKIIERLESYDKYHNIFPHDQFYISEQVYENRSKFYIFNPKVINTPNGIVVKHNWKKDKRLFDDCEKISKNEIEDVNTVFDIKKYLDRKYFEHKFK